MKDKKPKNYPFVTPQIANFAKQHGFTEWCFAVYEKGNSIDGEKVTAKLFHPGLKIAEVIKLLKDSKMYEVYLKRPGMFELNSLPPWCINAPMYYQLVDWFKDEHRLNIEINNDGRHNDIYELMIVNKNKEVVSTSIIQTITEDLNQTHKTFEKIYCGTYSNYYKALHDGVRECFLFLKDKKQLEKKKYTITI